MHTYFHIGSLTIPAYGMMISSGLIIANIIAYYVIKKTGLNIYDLLILEAYGVLGAFLGAKILCLIVSYKDIEWNRFFEPDYFNQLMSGGFVFYGGLIGALLLIFAAGRFHKLDAPKYLTTLVFMIPFMHGFGRIGCFLAGCCYGIPYDGFGAVVFPEGSFAPANIPMFPVQLVEAFLLIILSAVIFIMRMKYNSEYTVEVYLVAYAIIRFILENLRYDDVRGHIGFLSTSQLISILMIAVAIFSFVVRRKK